MDTTTHLPGPIPPPPSCHLLEGALTFVLQGFLGLCALGTLVYKWSHEYPKRERKVFVYDVSKQACGMAFAHVINIWIAYIVNTHYVYGDECRWYFVNLLLDSTIGTGLNWIYLKIFHTCIRKRRWVLCQTGDYRVSYTRCNKSFMIQVAIWLCIINLSKWSVFLCCIVPFHHQLNALGKILLSGVSAHPSLELCVVMFLVPLACNLFQFWIQDTFLKGKRHYLDRSLYLGIGSDISNGEEIFYQEAPHDSATHKRYPQLELHEGSTCI